MERNTIPEFPAFGNGMHGIVAPLQAEKIPIFNIEFLVVYTYNIVHSITHKLALIPSGIKAGILRRG